ncbi:MAG TPA: hypothetical protein VGZ52_02780 [Acidimicrobiales bacterium]|nr:hypothetical protein [Acidimicrobiales bacterium]
MKGATSGPGAAVGLVAALLVLVAGIAAALTRGDSSSTSARPPIVSSTRPVTSSAAPSGSAATTTTKSTLPPLATTPTTAFDPAHPPAKPAIGSPEAAANGLWASYTSNNRAAAQRFATDEVINALFDVPFSGEEGVFQGCQKQPDGTFACRYDQSSTRYEMTAQADASGSFQIVVLSIGSAG